MAEKTVTILIDEKGNSSIDLEGFADNRCSKVLDDFRGGDRVKAEYKKAAYYNQKQKENQAKTGR